jgi:hypothetical protein
MRLADGCLRRSFASATGSRNAAYLCEQALEQVIRALATSEGLHIERQDAHQLDRTLRRFPAENAVLSQLQSLSWLEAYATTFRYASPSGRLPVSPDPERLSVAVEALDKLIGIIVRHFGIDIDQPEQLAQKAAPMR